MQVKRALAVALTVTVTTTFLAACSDSAKKGDFTVTGSDTGVRVAGPNAAVDGEVAVELAQSPPEMATQYRQVGEVTRITGKLTGDVTVTMPVPQGYTGSIDDLWIVKGDGDTWLPLIPQTVDEENRTVSVTTRAFSFWTLGTWQAEQAAAQWAADLRNLTSSDGAWVISDAARLTGNAPVTECRYPALTLKLDQSTFVPRAILCPKFVTQGSDAAGRTTYDLHISNVQTYPVKLWLNSGVTFKHVTPAPNNPIAQLMDAMARSRHVVTLPGAGELVLTVRADQIPHGGVKISGGLDFTTLMVDLMFAAISTATGFDLKGEFVQELGRSNALAAYSACVVAGSKKLAEEFQRNADVDFAEFAGKIFKESFGCMKSDLLVAVLKDYYRNHGIFMSDEELIRWLAKMPARIVTVLQNAPVLVSLASAIGTVKYGRTTYLLDITNNDPAHAELYKALPDIGRGGFGADGGNRPQNADPTWYLGDFCTLEAKDKWRAWTESFARGLYRRGPGGKAATSVNLVYVREQHRQAAQRRIEQFNVECLDGLAVRSGPRYGGAAHYRAGVAGSGGFPTAVVWLYDMRKGVVLQVVATSGPSDGLTADDVLKEAQAAADYAAHKTDVTLGTSFALGT